AVAVADLAHAPEVSRHRGEYAGRRPAHRLRHEADDPLGAQAPDRLVEFARKPLAVLLGALARGPVAIFVARRHMLHVHQQGTELGAAPGIASHRKGAERVAVIALPAGDEALPPRFADLDEVLPGHLERRLDGLRAAR